MDATKTRKTIERTVTEEVDVLSLTLTPDEARTLWTLAGFDKTIPDTLAEYLSTAECSSIMRLLRMLRAGIPEEFQS